MQDFRRQITMQAHHFKADQMQEDHKCHLDRRLEQVLLLEDQVSSLSLVDFTSKISNTVNSIGHFPSPGPAGPGNFAGGQFGMPPGSPFHGPGPHPMQGGKIFVFFVSKPSKSFKNLTQQEWVQVK